MIVHQSNSRGTKNYSWLKAKHTFSFADYYNPERMNFGVLRVLNDDTIEPTYGFDMHSHKNMEIITIPIKGSLQHKDNLGNTSLIKKGDIQVMSAGSGIMHSEINIDTQEAVNLLQIWIIPNQLNVTPRYQQITLKPDERKNKLQLVLSPIKSETIVWIHQNAWFYLGTFENEIPTIHQLNDASNGLYIFVISGKMMINNQVLNERDAVALEHIQSVQLKSLEDNTEVLVMEIPMNDFA